MMPDLLPPNAPSDVPEAWRFFWAKSNRGTVHPASWCHPLWAHLLDVGACARRLWDAWMPAALRRRLAGAVALSEEEAADLLSFLVALHDAGKATPGFFYQDAALADHLHAEGFPLPRPAQDVSVPHGHATLAIVRRWLYDDTPHVLRLGDDAPPLSLLEAWTALVGIHHGGLLDEAEAFAWTSGLRPELGPQSWRPAQTALVEAVRQVLWPRPLPEVLTRADDAPWPEVGLAFAGWATLADWLGSSHDAFHPNDGPGVPPVPRTADLAAYAAGPARAGADRALAAAGLRRAPRLVWHGTAAHFGFAPRPLQTAAEAVASADAPTLVVVEAPTGEGKSEAAYALAALLGEGAYLALPTRATATAQWKRFDAFLRGAPASDGAPARTPALPPGAAAALRLAHGRDLLEDDALRLAHAAADTLATPGDTAEGADTGRPVAAEAEAAAIDWLRPRKRALLAPFGVGTVDQALFGVLPVRHFFLRHAALAGKTVIFDEVHAYDAYQNVLFETALRWLRAAGASAVVLSATLPDARRDALLRAWGAAAPDAPGGALAPYPALWTARTGTPATVTPVEADPARAARLRLEWTTDTPDAMATLAAEAARRGAAVLVVCNTVARAQAVFAALPEGMPDRHLLHARFPAAHRQHLDETVVTRFGKTRPAGGAVLVGTQVVEQSLDLDCDLVITDLVPVDLLLQRAGRGHRHARPRPEGFETPRLVVAAGTRGPDGLPNVEEVSAFGKVYDRDTLWRTARTVDAAIDGGGWTLPLGDADGRPGFRALVETVYGADRPPLAALYPDADPARLGREADAAASRRRASTQHGDYATIASPERLRDLFGARHRVRPDTGDEARLGTREDDASVEVVVLHLLPDGRWSTRAPDGSPLATLVTPDGPAAVFTPGTPHPALTPDDVRALLGGTLRLRRNPATTALLDAHRDVWAATVQRLPLLAHIAPLVLDARGHALGAPFRLDLRLGLLLTN